ncbi:MAG TPA: hypothetical protein VM686_00180 [Polyangiaceae bacterium]|jgi:hypothetical protein|nr:hypothetical protein [Polyangiaceae bacterium]
MSASEDERLSAALFEHGELSPALLGRSVAAIATAAGIERPYPIRLLVAPLPLTAVDGPLGREKLVPVLSLFVAQGETRRRGPTNRRPFGPFVDSTGHFR